MAVAGNGAGDGGEVAATIDAAGADAGGSADESAGVRDDEGDGVTGTGLAGDPHATTSSPVTTVATTRDREWRISCPPDDVRQKDFRPDPIGAPGTLSPCRHQAHPG